MAKDHRQKECYSVGRSAEVETWIEDALASLEVVAVIADAVRAVDVSLPALLL